MKIIRIPSLKDNYIWILYNSRKQCVVIDPGEAFITIQTIKKLKLKLIAILLTHHHHDHTNGINELLNYYPVAIYGPKETIINGTTKIIKEGNILHLIDHDFHILELPGHTAGHVGFYSKPLLFCGDTLFSAGCGKIIEGTPQKMYESIQKIKKLPKNTIVYCAHEYTINNLIFALSILPKNNNIINYYNQITSYKTKIKYTIPTTLDLELQINPFLISNEIYKNNNNIINFTPFQIWHVFAELRKKKDQFQHNHITNNFR